MMPHMKPAAPNKRKKNCNRGTALERSVDNYEGLTIVLLAQNFALCSDSVPTIYVRFA